MKTLEQLLDHQAEVMDAVAGRQVKFSAQRIVEQAFALMVEIGELVQEFNWKPWKHEKPVSRSRALDELADVWAFTLNLTNLVMDETGASADDVEQAYLLKARINLARARGDVPGYGRKEV